MRFISSPVRLVTLSEYPFSNEQIVELDGETTVKFDRITVVWITSACFDYVVEFYPAE
jgi:hypothetical protein